MNWLVFGYLSFIGLLTPCLSDRFHFIEDKKTYEKAEHHCRDVYTDLVTINDNETATQLLKLYPNKKFWIGHDTPWFSHCKVSQPPPACRDKCVLANGKEKWKCKDCKDKRHFVCYDDELFLVNGEQSTWEEALDYCRERSHDLVTVSSNRLQHWVNRQARNATTRYVWLGLKYTCVLDFWFWVSNERLEYEHWDKDIERECGAAGALDRQTNMWVSRKVTERLNFICEKCHDDDDDS